MVANADRRKELVKNTIKFLRQNHFDGLDLDWEYPSFRDGGKSRDRDNYAQLVQELREEFDRESEKTGRPRLLLTMAVPAGIEYINKGYDIPKLNEYLDWMNILSYDYHSAYEPAVNHHSPLYPIEEENEYSLDIDLNIDYTIKHYLKMGADKSKLVLGIPTYGRSYTLYNPDANEIGSPADGPGEMGEATRENGYLAYYEICENLKSDDWIIEAPYPDAMGPYAYNNHQWVGYDDEEIASKKAEYVAKNGLGGIMFWSIDNDDFRGKCGDRPYPIIEAAKEALLKAYGLTDASLIATTKKPIKNRSKIRGTTKRIESTTESSPAIRPRPNSRRKNINRVTEEGKPNSSKRRPVNGRSKKKQQTTTLSSISSLVVTPSYTTPAPPSTPDSGGDFKCEDEGFFPHPKDCKKYFWCLSGPSDLGIVAHQFTCPAGLYFNKAAASCDYSQNVLCNKKLSKSTTTTTTTTISPTVESISSTRKPPPKITAATSRTTVTTTEEPEIEDDYEEEYDEEILGVTKDAEQDPRVIKELIELIKKAGGIEELEKQLNISDGSGGNVVNGNVNLDATTRSTLNKSLYERVLGRATATLNEQKKSSFKTYNTIGRNSRGPQNEGIESGKIEKSIESPKTRGRPQYTSIIRSRPSTEVIEKEIKKPVEEDEQNEQDGISEPPSTRLRSSPFRKSQPEYVTIRRQRITTTTEINETNDKDDKESYSDDEENESKFRPTTSSPYVTIKRFRPTTEKSNDDTNNENIEENITTSRYVELRSRGTTTSTEASSTYSPDVPSTESTIDENLNSVEENTVENTDVHGSITELNNVINKTDGLKDVVDNIREIINSQKEEEAEKLPVLADPRPFSLHNQKKHTFTIPSTTTTKTTTQDILENQRLKVSVGINKNFNQQQEDGNNDVLDDEKFPSKHRFSTETSNDDYQINKRIRGRGQSRFTGHQTVATTVRTRPVIKITEKPYSDYEIIESNRKYRPDIVAEISDLSSLLAVDLKDLNSGRKSGRRRRPTTTTTTASTTTTTPEPNEIEKTGSRPIPLARKLLNGAQFGRSNRFRSTTTTSTSTVGLVGENKDIPLVEGNDSGISKDVTEKVVIKKFGRPPVFKNANRFRKNFNTTDKNEKVQSTTNQSTTNQLTENQSTTNQIPSTTTTLRSLPTRRRIVLRKLIKPHTTSTTTSTSTATTTTITIPSTTEKEILTSQNVALEKETETVVTEYETKENESASTVAETTTNTIKLDDDKETVTLRNEILETKKILIDKDETDDDKSEEADDNEEEGENIKLSESIVRESSQNFRNNLQEGVIFGKGDKSFKSIDFDEKRKFTTELPYSIRTRKIIRKLTTTESPEIHSTETDTKFKKITSRLKPTTGFGNDKFETSTISLLNKEQKRKYGFRRLSLPKKLNENENEPEIKISTDGNQAENLKPIKPTSFKPNRPIFRRRKIKNQERNEHKFITSTLKPLQEDLRLNKSLYNRRIPTFTVYSTTTSATDNYNLNQNEEESTISTENDNESGRDKINYEPTTEFAEKDTSILDNLRTIFEEEDVKETTTIDLKDLKEIISTTSLLNDQTTLSDDETTINDDGTTLSDDKTTFSDHKPTFRDDETTLSDDETTLSNEKTTLRDDKTTLSDDKTTLSDVETTLSDDKTTLSNVETTLRDDKTTIRDDETTLNDNKTTLNEEYTTLTTKIEESFSENEQTTEDMLQTTLRSTLKPKSITSSINHPATRYGESSNLTLFSRVGRLYLKNKQYGGINNLLDGDKSTQSSTTESPLSKLLNRKKELDKLSTTTEKEENEKENVQYESDLKEITTENDEFTTNQEDLITTVNDLITTTDLDDSSSIETTTEFITTTTTTRKPSRLFRPIALRPKFTGRLKSDLSTTSTTSIPLSSERIKTNRFNKYKPTPRRFYLSSTTENQEKDDVIIDESDEYVDELVDAEEKEKQKPSLFSKPGYKPSYIILKPSDNEDEYENTENVSSQKPPTRTYKKFTTPSSVVSQNLPDINITVVSQRNRNLFNKTRKMNTPFPNIPLKNETNTTNSIEQSLLTSTKQDEITEKITSTTTTTEKVTTLHHIFAETENSNEMTTKSYPQHIDEKKVEKIVEINRIVKVTSKVKNGTDEKIDGDDKVDKSRLLVSRVVEIKVVESDNGTNITRQDKKYETNQKNDFNIPVSNNQNGIQVNQIRIDSVSSSKKITPKPFYSVETATIPLEGLFQTNHPPEEKIDLQNELLEGENSNYVNVRVLQQDTDRLGDRRKIANAKFIPVRILKDSEDEEVKADVIEVTPSESNQQIRIVPISVSIQKTN